MTRDPLEEGSEADSDTPSPQAAERGRAPGRDRGPREMSLVLIGAAVVLIAVGGTLLALNVNGGFLLGAGVLIGFIAFAINNSPDGSRRTPRKHAS